MPRDAPQAGEIVVPLGLVCGHDCGKTVAEARTGRGDRLSGRAAEAERQRDVTGSGGKLAGLDDVARARVRERPIHAAVVRQVGPSVAGAGVASGGGGEPGGGNQGAGDGRVGEMGVNAGQSGTEGPGVGGLAAVLRRGAGQRGIEEHIQLIRPAGPGGELDVDDNGRAHRIGHVRLRQLPPPGVGGDLAVGQRSGVVQLHDALEKLQNITGERNPPPQVHSCRQHRHSPKQTARP